RRERQGVFDSRDPDRPGLAALQRVEILRRHMVDELPSSGLCNGLGLQPSVFYQWQRQLHDNLAGALHDAGTGGTRLSPGVMSRWYMRTSARKNATTSGPTSKPMAPKAATPPSNEKKTMAPCISMPRFTSSGLMRLSTSPTTRAPHAARKT